MHTAYLREVNLSQKKSVHVDEQIADIIPVPASFWPAGPPRLGDGAANEPGVLPSCAAAPVTTRSTQSSEIWRGSRQHIAIVPKYNVRTRFVSRGSYWTRPASM